MRRTLRKEAVDWFDEPAEVVDIISDEPPPDDLTRAVYVFAFDGERLLLTRRRGDAEWSLPGGERRAGESLEDTARRVVSETTGCELGTLGRLGWQQVRFPEKVPADWTYGPDSYIRLYLADVADASPIQAANRQFLAPVEARAQPAVQDNHLFFEEALLVATGRS
jgi:ADP-ribose pyrophosphatase YjhB (NUDIX family)